MTFASVALAVKIQLALSKIQTFHTTYGEDNQIYSTEEILDPTLDKLFDEGIKAEENDRNLEIPFYEELRALYVKDRKEYNRISKISLRSRSGRESKTYEGVKLSEDTVVFLKTNYRKVFYRASDISVEELSNIDAMNYLKASPEEPKVERIANHHKHVEKAIEQFNNDRIVEFNEAEFAPVDQGNLGVQVVTAMNLLDAIFKYVEDDEVRLKLAHLKSLVRDGVITSVAMKLQKWSKQLNSGRITLFDVLQPICDMADKYDPYYISESEKKQEEETSPEIILSESFK